MARRVAIAGASLGIGAACARLLAGEGARLFLCAREPGPLAELAVALSALGAQVHAIAADVSTDAGAQAFADAAFAQLGGVDLGLICVGGAHPPVPVQAAQRQLLLDALEANAVAPALAAGALLRGWAQRLPAGAPREDRHVLVLSSLATRRPPLQRVGPYTAGKHALESLVRTLAEEAWPHARINALCLGPVATRLHAQAGTPPEATAHFALPAEIAPLVLRAERALAGQSGRALDAEALAQAPEVALAGDGRLAFVLPLQHGDEPDPEPEPGRRPSPRVRRAIRSAAEEPQRYPRETSVLRARIAALHGTQPDAVLLSGGGATELIERALRAFCIPGDEVLSPFPTFDVLPALCSREGMRHRPVLARRLADGTFGPHAAAPLLAAVGPRTRLVYVAAPDNPTGALLPAAEAEALRANLPAGTTLLLDEAWSSEAPQQQPEPASGGAALVRLRSLSKLHGLAGLRIGYAVASPAAAEALRRLELPYPLGAPQLAGALAALEEPERTRRAALLLKRERARVAQALRALGLIVSGGEAPVLLVRDPRGPAAGKLAFALRAAGAAAGEAHWDPAAVVLGLGARAQNRRSVAALRRALLDDDPDPP